MARLGRDNEGTALGRKMGQVGGSRAEGGVVWRASLFLGPSLGIDAAAAALAAAGPVDQAVSTYDGPEVSKQRSSER
jgi:hypothetical protein